MNSRKMTACIKTLVLWALAMVASAQVQNNHEAEVILQEAKHRALVDGDLERAIDLCKKIVAEHSSNRAVVAQALVEMGKCYEKLGRAEARKAYERVVQEFADQSEPVRVAREHLEKLDTGAPSRATNGPTYRLVLDEKMAGMPVGRGRDFSPSGDRIVFVSQYRLYITDQAGAVTRPLLDDLGPWEEANWPCWSPDGKLIAYQLSRGVLKDSGGEEILSAVFVIDPDGGIPRQVGPDVKGSIRSKVLWTSDSRNVSYWTKDGLYTFTLDGKLVRSIPRKDLPGIEPWYCNYSPDGRWLVSVKREGQPDELWICPAAGGALRHLVDLPGSYFPTWAPDGRTLYFVRYTRGYGPNIWKIPMDLETGLAAGEPRQVTFFRGTSIWYPQVLDDGNQIAFGMERAATSIQVADASAPEEARSLVHSGNYAPELSPDAQTVYYVNNSPEEEGIYAVSRQGGTPRRLTNRIPIESHKWLPCFDISPDGLVLACVTKQGEEFELFTLATSGGTPRPLVRIASKAVVPQWSPDGSQLAYADGKSIYVISAAAGKPRELAHLDRGWEEWTVRWSPDGKYIAAFSSDMDKTAAPGPQNAVFVVPASGGELRQLTPDVEYKEGLEWHPDSKRLTYHVSRYNSETRQVYLDGRPPSLLLDAPDIWDYVGTWAPDGHQFFFVGDSVGGDWGMYIYDEVSGEIAPVAANLRHCCVPCWSRDGKTMAWYATKQTSPQIWVMENFLPK